MQRRVFIGYDDREALAYRACVRSMYARASCVNLLITPISSRLLGVLYRRTEERREDGILIDTASKQPMSTQFSMARFFVPLLARERWVLFCDCDFLWRGDVEQVFAMANDRFAVMVVKHDFVPHQAVKMDGQIQRAYPRKCWSSLMLLNCDAPEVRSLDEAAVNHMGPDALHGFAWVSDGRIGELPMTWNWLAGVSPRDADPRAVHYTLGTPDMPGYEQSPFADEWRGYALG